MKHGYTNRTEECGESVRKTYRGPDARNRRHVEERALTSVLGHVPVPAVLSSGPGWLETAYVSGRHGQDLLDAGAANEVLSECGRVLRTLHSLDPRLLDPHAPEQAVIQHGDFGPNNVLFSRMPRTHSRRTTLRGRAKTEAARPTLPPSARHGVSA